MAKTHKKRSTKNRSIKKRGGGIGDGLFGLVMGAQYLRKGKFDHWLEERLVLHFDDAAYVQEVRKKFGYDKTNMFTWKVDDIKKRTCKRDPNDIKLIAPLAKYKC